MKKLIFKHNVRKLSNSTGLPTSFIKEVIKDAINAYPDSKKKQNDLILAVLEAAGTLETQGCWQDQQTSDQEVEDNPWYKPLQW